DGCGPCQDETRNRITRHSPSTARLVELACIAVAEQLGGLPRNLTERGVPGLASEEFRSLARAGCDGHSDALYAACAALNDEQRRAAADSAGDLLVGMMSLSTPETPA
ncbi:hypothetical protein, partial [Nocardia sp. NPDC057455]|uniref:hypothetical protein n=1 Tax=Nocardia sp. NPDC057455 TaxID=3346138 RepID=UPI00366C2B08